MNEPYTNVESEWARVKKDPGKLREIHIELLVGRDCQADGALFEKAELVANLRRAADWLERHLPDDVQWRTVTDWDSPTIVELVRIEPQVPPGE